MKNTNPVIVYLKSIYADDRSTKNRILCSLMPIILLSFNVVFFSNLLTLISNSSTFIEAFSIRTVIIVFIMFVLSVVLLLGFSLILKGKVLDSFLCALTGISLGVYVQINFLNSSMPLLNGEMIHWEEFVLETMLGLLCWFILLLIPFFVRKISYSFWKKGTTVLAAFLIAIQLVAIIVLSFSIPDSRIVLTMDNANKLSDKENVFVFVLDAVSDDVLAETFVEYPETLDEYKDFTRYTNCSTPVLGTFPSTINLLTNTTYEYEISVYDYIEKAWMTGDANSFYSELRQENFDINIYGGYNYYFSTTDIGSKVATNIKSLSEYDSNILDTIPELLQTTAFIISPNTLKPFFWTANYNDAYYELMDSMDINYFSNNAARYHDFVIQNGYTIDDEKNNFSSFHFSGVHSPLYIDQDGEDITGSVTEAQSLRGHLKIINTLLKSLKHYGLYDDATIIILADHGAYSKYSPLPMFMMKMPGETLNSMKINTAPIINTDLIPTIATILGFNENNSYGTPVFEIDPNKQRERSLNVYVDSHEYFHKYNLPLRAEDFRYTDQQPDEIIELQHDFYYVD